MKKRDKIRLRLTIECDDQAVTRVSVKERLRDGSYAAVERPWTMKVLAASKRAAKAATLVGRGVADLGEVRRAASAPRHRKVGKKQDTAVIPTDPANIPHNGSDQWDEA